MSQEPVRLLAENGASSAERELLRAGLDVDPPPSAKSEVWAALAVRIPPVPPVPPSPAPSSALLTGAWKAGAIGAAIGLLLAGGAGLAERGNAQTRAPNPASVSTTGDRPARAAEPSLEAEPVAAMDRALPSERPKPTRRPILAAAETPPAPTAVAELPPAPKTPEERRSQLREESRLLREARAALRAGDAARCLSLLAESLKKHEMLVLGQEHEALGIEALAASGAREAARQRAKAFVERFPSSPHASKLETIAASP